MLRNIFATMFLLVGMGVVNADNHVAPVALFFGISTDNGSAVVEAWDQYMSSDCAKGFPGQITIMNEFFNGDYPATHTVIMNFPDAKAWEASFASYQCTEWGTLLQSTGAISSNISQSLGVGVLQKGDQIEDLAYTIVQMTITDESAYTEAFDDWMSAQIKAGQKISSYGLVRIVGGRHESTGTHFAYIGVKSNADLIGNSLGNDAKLLQKFQGKVDGIRTLHRINVNYVGKRY